MVRLALFFAIRCDVRQPAGDAIAFSEEAAVSLFSCGVASSAVTDSKIWKCAAFEICKKVDLLALDFRKYVCL